MSVSFPSFRRLRKSRSRVHSADRRFHHRWSVINIAASPHVLTSNLKPYTDRRNECSLRAIFLEAFQKTLEKIKFTIQAW